MEFLLFLVFGGIALMLAVGAVVLLPLMLIGTVLKVLFLVLTIPFRIVGAAIGAIGGLFGAIFGGVFSLIGLVFGALALAGGLLLLPIIPVIALFGLIWLFTRSSRRVANS